jgi:hypothetical protein
VATSPPSAESATTRNATSSLMYGARAAPGLQDGPGPNVVAVVNVSGANGTSRFVAGGRGFWRRCSFVEPVARIGRVCSPRALRQRSVRRSRPSVDAARGPYIRDGSGPGGRAGFWVRFADTKRRVACLSVWLGQRLSDPASSPSSACARIVIFTVCVVPGMVSRTFGVGTMRCASQGSVRPWQGGA